MTRSPVLLLGIVAAIVLGLGVTLVVLVKQANAPVAVEAAPAATPPPAVETPVVAAPTVAPPVAVPTPVPTPDPAPVAEVVATPPPPPTPAPVAAEVVATPPTDGDAMKHKNHRFNRGLMPNGHRGAAAAEAAPPPAP